MKDTYLLPGHKNVIHTVVSSNQASVHQLDIFAVQFYFTGSRRGGGAKPNNFIDHPGYSLRTAMNNMNGKLLLLTE